MRSTRRWKSAPNHPWQRPSAVPRPWTPHNNLLHITAIFWHSEAQREAAQSAITQLEAALGRQVVSELRPEEPVYAAEPEHQAYFSRNPGQAYCAVVIAPKLRKFRMNFPGLQRADTI